MKFLENLLGDIAGPLIGGLFGLANNPKNQPVAMSDYDWDKYQRQLNRANPQEIQRQAQFLEGLQEPQAQFDSAQIRGTMDAENERMGLLGQTGINLEEQAVRQVGEANIDMEQRRVDALGQFGLNPWELLGNNQSINQVTAPSVPNQPGRAKTPNMQNGQMLSQLIGSATQLQQTQMQTQAQITAAAIGAGANIGSSKIGAEAAVTSSKLQADAKLDSNEVERLKARIQEAGVSGQLKRWETLNRVDKDRLTLDVMKAVAHEIPKEKFETVFGTITQARGTQAKELIRWATTNMETVPTFISEMSDPELTAMIDRTAKVADLGIDLLEGTEGAVRGGLHWLDQTGNFLSGLNPFK
jgi:hypothetical protein